MFQKLAKVIVVGTSLTAAEASLEKAQSSSPEPSPAAARQLERESINSEDVSRPSMKGTLAAKTAAFAATLTTALTFPPNAADEPEANQNRALDLSTPEIQRLIERLNREQPETYKDIPQEYFADKGFVREAARRVPELIGKAIPALQNDLDFIKNTLIEKREDSTSFYHGVLDHINPEHLDNERFMRSLLKAGMGVYNDASPRLRENRDFLDFAVKSDAPINLAKLPPNFRSDRELMEDLVVKGEAHINRNTNLSDLLPKDILHDKELWLKAVRKNSELFSGLPLEVLHDKDFITKAIARSAYVYTSLPQDLQADRQIATALYRTSPISARDLPDSLQKDRAFMVSLLRHNGAGFQALSDEQKRDPALIAAAAETNAGILSLVPRDVLAKNSALLNELAIRSYNTRAPLEKSLGTLPREVAEIYTNTEQALKVLGFSEHTYKPRSNKSDALGQEQTGRFDATQEVIRNRYEVSPPKVQERLEQLLGKQYFAGLPNNKDTRPKVMVILPHSDDRGAFDQREGFFSTNDLVDEATRSNKALVYEVGTKQQLLDARDEVVAHGQVDHLVVGAHGASDIMSFGGLDPGENKISYGDKRFLTVKDAAVFKRLGGLVADGGSVILMSCSTGSTEASDKNMATAFHAAFPHASVHAPTEPTTVVRVVNATSGLVEPPSFSAGFKPIQSYTAPAQKRAQFTTRGLDSETARAVSGILQGDTYPISFSSEIRNGETFINMATDGQPGGSFVRYDRNTESVRPLPGNEAAVEATKSVVVRKVYDVLTDASTTRLWTNFDKERGEPGYISPNDDLLVRTKEAVASELGVSASSISLSLRRIPGAINGLVYERGAPGSRPLVSILAAPTGKNGSLEIAGSSEVDLQALGRLLNK